MYAKTVNDLLRSAAARDNLRQALALLAAPALTPRSGQLVRATEHVAAAAARRAKKMR